MSRLRVGVVGLGGIAQTAHLPLLRRRWDLVELTALADLSAARLAQVGAMYGVPPQARFGSLTGLLDSGLVDAVVLATTGSHGPAVLQAVRAGVPVLCEKPLAFTVAEAAATVDAAVGAGAPAHLRTLYTNVILGSVIHDVSLLRHLLGGVESIDGALHWPAGVLPGSVELGGTVAGGARLHLAWHYLDDYPVYRETVTVHHATGTVQLVFPAPYLLNAPTEALVVSGDGGTELRTVARDVSEASERELVAFHAMATAGTAPSSGTAEAMADIATAQAAVRAIAAADGVVLGGEVAHPA